MGSPYRNATWSPTITATFTGSSGSDNMLTVSEVSAGELGIGQLLNASNIPPNTFIFGFGTGTGGIGTYQINQQLELAPETINATPGMVYEEIQQYLTRFQLSALSTQDPANATQLTASDILNYAAYAMQSETTVASLESVGVGIMRIEDIQNPYFSDDRQRYEASPSLDFTLSYKQQIISYVPIVQGEIVQILPV